MSTWHDITVALWVLISEEVHHVVDDVPLVDPIAQNVIDLGRPVKIAVVTRSRPAEVEGCRTAIGHSEDFIEAAVGVAHARRNQRLWLRRVEHLLSARVGSILDVLHGEAHGEPTLTILIR